MHTTLSLAVSETHRYGGYRLQVSIRPSRPQTGKKRATGQGGVVEERTCQLRVWCRTVTTIRVPLSVADIGHLPGSEVPVFDLEVCMFWDI